MPGQNYFARIATLNEEVDKLLVEAKSAEQVRNALRRELATAEPALPLELTTRGGSTPGGGSTPSQDALARLDAERKRLDDLRMRFTDAHPEVAAARATVERLEAEARRLNDIEARALAVHGMVGKAAINETYRPLYQRLRGDLSEAEVRAAALASQLSVKQSQLAQMRELADRMPRLETEMAQLSREQEMARKNYEQMLARSESASLGAKADVSAELAEFRIVEPTTVSRWPAFPGPLHGAAGLLLLAPTAGPRGRRTRRAAAPSDPRRAQPAAARRPPGLGGGGDLAHARDSAPGTACRRGLRAGLRRCARRAGRMAGAHGRVPDRAARARRCLKPATPMKLIEQAVQRLEQLQPAPEPGCPALRCTWGSGPGSGGTRRGRRYPAALGGARPGAAAGGGCARCAEHAIKTQAKQSRRMKLPLLANIRMPQASSQRLSLIMVTSALPGEGKTYCATNLALSLAAEIDQQVLLVDADVVHPQLASRLGVEAGAGLLDLLRRPYLQLGEVALGTNINNLALLPAGTPDALTTERLAARRCSAAAGAPGQGPRRGSSSSMRARVYGHQRGGRAGRTGWAGAARRRGVAHARSSRPARFRHPGRAPDRDVGAEQDARAAACCAPGLLQLRDR